MGNCAKQSVHQTEMPPRKDQAKKSIEVMKNTTSPTKEPQNRDRSDGYNANTKVGKIENVDDKEQVSAS